MKLPRRKWLVIGTFVVLGLVVAAAIGLVVLILFVRAGQEARTRSGGLEMLSRANEFRSDQSRWPADEVECYGAEVPPFDAWGMPLRLVIEGPSDDAELLVWSAGVDRVRDSADDWVVASEPRDLASRDGLRQRPR